MSNLEIEVIEKGMELSNDDLFQVLGGAAGCGCQCKSINYQQLGPKKETDDTTPIK